MKFTLGFIAGIGTAWAALAVWQHRLVETRTIDLDALTEEPDPSTPWWMRAPSASMVDITAGWRETVLTSEPIDVNEPPIRHETAPTSRCNFEWKSLSMGRVQCLKRYPGHGPRHIHDVAWVAVGSELMPGIEGRWLQ